MQDKYVWTIQSMPICVKHHTIQSQLQKLPSGKRQLSSTGLALCSYASVASSGITRGERLHGPKFPKLRADVSRHHAISPALQVCWHTFLSYRICSITLSKACLSYERDVSYYPGWLDNFPCVCAIPSANITIQTVLVDPLTKVGLTV